MTADAWECVIGLEVHVQLRTRSKIFSGAATAFGAEANAQACAVDLALPGVLPVLNEAAVRHAVLFGLAVDGQIAERCRFHRKSYFYPDLPKGYQISQLDEPIVRGGRLDIETEAGSRRIALTRAHLEEDAGKSLHEDYAGHTGVDLNRAGVPLLEVVSEPALRSAEEAVAYFRALRALVRALGICDGRLNEGSMRCDANVSMRRPGAPLGERTEIKNLNSFRFLERALRFEVARQTEALEAGGKVARQTLLYDAERDETRPMRGKELAEDYRYFPDPDLLPVVVPEALLAELRAQLPELPAAKRRRYRAELGLSAYDAAALVEEPQRAAYFEAVLAAGADAKAAANWLLGEVAAAQRRDQGEAERASNAMPVPPAQLGRLLQRIAEGAISGTSAKGLFERLWRGEAAGEGAAGVDRIIERHGLAQVSGADALAPLVAAAVAEHPRQAAEYRAGKAKLFGFFVGQVMKATRGQANAQQVGALLREALRGEDAGDGAEA